MELVIVETDEGSQEVLVDPKNKVFLTLKSQENAPSTCKPVFTVCATEYSKIKVLSADLAMFDMINVDHHLDPSDLDIDLEIRTSESYLMYYFQTVLQDKMGDITNKLCSLNKDSLGMHELSPFHPNNLLRIRGDVIQEL
jgi:hypothetical protein